MLIEVCFYPQCERVTFHTPQDPGQVLHHARIAIERREWLTIGRVPPPQAKAWRFELKRPVMIQATLARIIDRPRASSPLQSGRPTIACTSTGEAGAS